MQYIVHPKMTRKTHTQADGAQVTLLTCPDTVTIRSPFEVKTAANAAAAIAAEQLTPIPAK